MEVSGTEYRALRRLAAGMGFSFVHAINGTTAFNHTALNPCWCKAKAKPYIQPSIYEAGKWLAICPKCGMRTVLASNPVQAVKFWNEENYTYESRITRDGMKKDREVMENDVFFKRANS